MGLFEMAVAVLLVIHIVTLWKTAARHHPQQPRVIIKYILLRLCGLAILIGLVLTVLSFGFFPSSLFPTRE